MLVRLDIITAEDLSAYVDGHLDAECMEAVAKAIQDDDRAARIVQGFRDQIANLHRLYGGATREAVPERLLDVIRRHRAET